MFSSTQFSLSPFSEQNHTLRFSFKEFFIFSAFMQYFNNPVLSYVGK